MEARGWLRRVRDLEDRRAIRVELLSAGAAKLDETRAPVEAALAGALRGLTGEESAVFTRLLLRLRAGAPRGSGVVEGDQQGPV